MDKLLITLRRAVERRSRPNDTIRDVRSSTMTFRSYRFVLLPVLAVALYYMFMASDRFVTTAQVYIKSIDATAAVLPQLQLLGGAGGNDKDALLVNAYISSQDMLNELDTSLKISEHFASDEWDYFSRMVALPSDEGRLKYFRSRLKANLDPDSGMITIRAQAYTPEFSFRMVQEAIKGSELFVNSVGQKIALQEIAFVEKEMVRARDNLQAVRQKLLQFQNDNGILSAEASGVSRQSIVNEMEAQLVRLRTEEKILSSYLNDGAAELIAVRGRIDAMTQQLVIEREKLASRDGVSLNDVNAAYQELELELKLATDLYQATLVSLEQARVESYKKLKHMVIVQKPQMPDDSTRPRKLYNVATLFIVLTLAYGIITMIIATIREHRDV